MSDHGTFNWNELMTRDLESSKAFYSAVLGWTFETMSMPDGDYVLAKKGDQTVGGFLPVSDDPQSKGMPEYWMPYVSVDDVDAAVAAARDAGGQVMRAPWDVAGVGRVGIVQDARGCALGLITPEAA